MIGFKGIGRRAKGIEPGAKSIEHRAEGIRLEVFFSLERGVLMYNTPRFC